MLLIDYFTQILIYTLVSYPIIGGLSFIVSSLYYWHINGEGRSTALAKKRDAVHHNFSAGT